MTTELKEGIYGTLAISFAVLLGGSIAGCFTIALIAGLLWLFGTGRIS